MTTGKDVWYFFAAYTAVFFILILYVIYLTTRLAKIERKVETPGQSKPSRTPMLD